MSVSTIRRPSDFIPLTRCLRELGGIWSLLRSHIQDWVGQDKNVSKAQHLRYRDTLDVFVAKVVTLAYDNIKRALAREHRNKKPASSFYPALFVQLGWERDAKSGLEYGHCLEFLDFFGLRTILVDADVRLLLFVFGARKEDYNINLSLPEQAPSAFTVASEPLASSIMESATHSFQTPEKKPKLQSGTRGLEIDTFWDESSSMGVVSSFSPIVGSPARLIQLRRLLESEADPTSPSGSSRSQQPIFRWLVFLRWLSFVAPPQSVFWLPSSLSSSSSSTIAIPTSSAPSSSSYKHQACLDISLEETLICRGLRQIHRRHVTASWERYDDDGADGLHNTAFDTTEFNRSVLDVDTKSLGHFDSVRESLVLDVPTVWDEPPLQSDPLPIQLIYDSVTRSITKDIYKYEKMITQQEEADEVYWVAARVTADLLEYQTAMLLVREIETLRFDAHHTTAFRDPSAHISHPLQLTYADNVKEGRDPLKLHFRHFREMDEEEEQNDVETALAEADEWSTVLAHATESEVWRYEESQKVLVRNPIWGYLPLGMPKRLVTRFQDMDEDAAWEDEEESAASCMEENNAQLSVKGKEAERLETLEEALTTPPMKTRAEFFHIPPSIVELHYQLRPRGWKDPHKKSFARFKDHEEEEFLDAWNEDREINTHASYVNQQQNTLFQGLDSAMETFSGLNVLRDGDSLRGRCTVFMIELELSFIRKYHGDIKKRETARMWEEAEEAESIEASTVIDFMRREFEYVSALTEKGDIDFFEDQLHTEHFDDPLPILAARLDQWGHAEALELQYIIRVNTRRDTPAAKRRFMLVGASYVLYVVCMRIGVFYYRLSHVP